MKIQAFAFLALWPISASAQSSASDAPSLPVSMAKPQVSDQARQQLEAQRAAQAARARHRSVPQPPQEPLR